MLLVLLTACSGGGRTATGPVLQRADAAPLISLSRRIAGEAPCAQAHDIGLLQQRAERLVNSGRVPEDLQEPLLGGVNALTADTPPCVPPAPAPVTTPTSPPEHGHGHKHKEKHGHGHGHGDGGD